MKVLRRIDIVLLVFCIDAGFGGDEKLANFNMTFNRCQMKRGSLTGENREVKR
jgi:hypothetical protein